MPTRDEQEFRVATDPMPHASAGAFGDGRPGRMLRTRDWLCDSTKTDLGRWPVIMTHNRSPKEQLDGNSKRTLLPICL